MMTGLRMFSSGFSRHWPNDIGANKYTGRLNAKESAIHIVTYHRPSRYDPQWQLYLLELCAFRLLVSDLIGGTARMPVQFFRYRLTSI